MQFLDLAKIKVRSGSGGNGAVSFRKEKFIEFGGPDGGNGGKGGDVIIRTQESLNTLIDFSYRRNFFAGNGKSGSGRQRHGSNGNDVILDVPIGTEILDESRSVLLFDLIAKDQQVTLLQGGTGGFGNAHFKSSTNQAPRIANSGMAGKELTIYLRLKIFADVGLVGLPNSGKSTFLSAVSNAKPKSGDYPFTTLYPKLGLVNRGDIDFTIADIPGLIQGSSEGKGLGDRFLGHVERSSVLLHLIDGTSNDPRKDFEIIDTELKRYGNGLSTKPRIVAVNKIDQIDSDMTKFMEELATEIPYKIYPVSALMRIGLGDCLENLAKALVDEQCSKKESHDEMSTKWTP
ncbi:MAG: GTPase ObgE [Paracoccaceae bacterium]|nr:GTPase ObgE [Paracoccaceae bacterium]MDE2675153.1 GTPase ObgE [Paracoccaceae bacterium]MDE2738697.1 GTPase ObgE [Paracoccaceae bacterium]